MTPDQKAGNPNPGIIATNPGQDGMNQTTSELRTREALTQMTNTGMTGVVIMMHMATEVWKTVRATSQGKELNKTGKQLTLLLLLPGTKLIQRSAEARIVTSDVLQ